MECIQSIKLSDLPVACQDIAIVFVVWKLKLKCDSKELRYYAEEVLRHELTKAQLRRLAAELVSINNCIESRIAYVDTANPNSFIDGSMPFLSPQENNPPNVSFD